MHQEALRDPSFVTSEDPSLRFVPNSKSSNALPSPLDFVPRLAKKQAEEQDLSCTIVDTPDGSKVIHLDPSNYQAASPDYSAPKARSLAKFRKERGRAQKEQTARSQGEEITPDNVKRWTNMFFQISASKDGENVASASIGAHVKRPLRDEFVSFVSRSLLGENAQVEWFGKKALIHIEVDEHNFRYSPQNILTRLTEVPRRASKAYCDPQVHEIQSGFFDGMGTELKGARGQEYADMLNGKVDHLIPAMRDGKTFVFNYKYQLDKEHNRYDYMAANADDLPQGMLDLAIKAPEGDTGRLLFRKHKLLRSVSKGKIRFVAEACGDDWADFCCGDAVNDQYSHAFPGTWIGSNVTLPSEMTRIFCEKCNQLKLVGKCKCPDGKEG